MEAFFLLVLFFTAIVILSITHWIRGRKASSLFEEFSGDKIEVYYQGGNTLDTFIFSFEGLQGKVEIGYLADTFLTDDENRYLLKSPRWPNKNKKYLLDHPTRSVTVDKSFKKFSIDGNLYELTYWDCFYGVVKKNKKTIAQFLMEDHKTKHTSFNEVKCFYGKVVGIKDLLTIAVFLNSYMRKVNQTMVGNRPDPG